METEARHVSKCLPSELTARIEVIKAQARAMEAQRLGSGAGTMEETTRAKPVGEESTGKVVRFGMPKHMATAIPSRLPRAAVVICLRTEKVKRHVTQPHW